MNKIIRIDSARHMDGESWEIGQEVGYKTGLLITEIRDVSAEFEHSLYVAYDIYLNGQLFKKLENMPVQIEYEIGGDN